MAKKAEIQATISHLVNLRTDQESRKAELYVPAVTLR